MILCSNKTTYLQKQVAMWARAGQTLVYANYLDTITLPAILFMEVLTDQYPC